MGRVAFPFDNVVLQARKPDPGHWPENPETIGEHIKRARLERDFLQRELAELLGVTVDTVRNWEKGRARPTLARRKVMRWLNSTN